LLDSAGFSGVVLDGIPDFNPDSRTHRYNCNGGLYILPREHLMKIREPWFRWSRYCLGQRDLLGRYIHHSDQLGFMLAMIELDLPFGSLPTGANFPTHFNADAYARFDSANIQAFHYHSHSGQDGLLLPTGSGKVDGFISRANKILDNYSRVDAI